MSVSEFMIAPPVTVTPDATARQAAQCLDQAAVGCLLVVTDGELQGIVTDRDLAIRCLAAGADPETPVAELMSAPVVTIGVDDDVAAAYRLFRRCGVRRLPVLDGGGGPAGLLAIDDLFLDVLQRLADLLGPVSWSALHEVPPGPGPTDPRSTSWNAVGAPSVTAR